MGHLNIVRLVALACAVGLALLPTGCSGGKASVSGKVVYKGKTMLTGSVILVGSDGNATSAAVGDGGAFEVEGLAPGKVKVGISSPSPVKAAVAEIRSKRTSKGAPPPPKAAKSAAPSNWFAIPDALSDPQTSGLTIDVVSGSNRMDIEVK